MNKLSDFSVNDGSEEGVGFQSVSITGDYVQLVPDFANDELVANKVLIQPQDYDIRILINGNGFSTDPDANTGILWKSVWQPFVFAGDPSLIKIHRATANTTGVSFHGLNSY